MANQVVAIEMLNGNVVELEYSDDMPDRIIVRSMHSIAAMRPRSPMTVALIFEEQPQFFTTKTNTNEHLDSTKG